MDFIGGAHCSLLHDLPNSALLECVYATFYSDIPHQNILNNKDIKFPRFTPCQTLERAMRSRGRCVEHVHSLSPGGPYTWMDAAAIEHHEPLVLLVLTVYA